MSKSVGDAIVRRVGVVIDSLRRQAPGARMIGEYAVKMLSRDVARRIGGSRTGAGGDPSSGGDDTSGDGSTATDQ